MTFLNHRCSFNIPQSGCSIARPCYKQIIGMWKNTIRYELSMHRNNFFRVTCRFWERSITCRIGRWILAELERLFRGIFAWIYLDSKLNLKRILWYIKSYTVILYNLYTNRIYYIHIHASYIFYKIHSIFSKSNRAPPQTWVTMTKLKYQKVWCDLRPLTCLLSRPLSHSASLTRNTEHLLSIPPVARSSPDGLIAQA